MWPSCCATAGVAARTNASSMHQNLNRPIGLRRAVGEEKDRYEERAFGTDCRRWGHRLPERQARDRRGRGERIGVEAEGDDGAAREVGPPRPRRVVKPHLEPRCIPGEQRDMLGEIGVEGIEQAEFSFAMGARLDLHMKWSERLRGSIAEGQR